MRRWMHKPWAFGLTYAVLLTSAFVMALLDTFVIVRRDRIVEVAKTTVEAVSELLISQTQEPTITDHSYDDGQIAVAIATLEYESTVCYVADVVIASPEWLRTALADNTFGRNVKQTTSAMAEANGAILAINGDYYGARRRGWVVRNGVILRDTAASDETDLLLVDRDGSFSILSDRLLSQETASALWQAFSFGPALVADGQVLVDANDEVSQAMTSNPRTAIGQIDALHYLFVVTDGRTEESEGLSLQSLAELMQSLGCTTAYNLDGGGSSTMVFMGEVVNNPTTSGRRITEREVSDIVYIGY